MAYIEDTNLIEEIKSLKISVGGKDVFPDEAKESVLRVINEQPTADVVLTAVMEQIKWERDIAIEQLASYGVCLGEKKELVEVRHGEWILHNDGSGTCKVCGRHQKHIWDMCSWQKYCGHCGAKMDGGKTE